MFPKHLAALGAALMPAVEGFVTPASPYHEISGLRGASGAPAASVNVASGDVAATTSKAVPVALGAAAGVAVASSVAGKRRARARTATLRRAAEKPETEAPPAPPAFDKTKQIGAQDPLGFWDPLDFCKDEAAFKDLRAKELKHGRAAMMGSVGMLTQSLVQVPGMEGVPKSCQAIFVGNGMIGGIAVLALIGALETFVFVQDEKKEPGNFGNPLPWFDDYSDEMRARELANGRVAMFAAIGQIAAGLYTGKDALQQFGV